MNPSPAPVFGGALLAGGRSTRMGQDKAGVLFEGRPLWDLQLARLRLLAPCELFISGRPDGPFANAGVEIVPDPIPDLGPLGGIAAILARATSPLVLVLAIDLPAMTVDFLTKLVKTGHAVIPENGRRFEPLAAVYPKSALPIAERLLRENDRSLQRFGRELIGGGLAQPLPISEAELSLFRNVNRPEDLN